MKKSRPHVPRNRPRPSQNQHRVPTPPSLTGARGVPTAEVTARVAGAGRTDRPRIRGLSLKGAATKRARGATITLPGPNAANMARAANAVSMARAASAVAPEVTGAPGADCIHVPADGEVAAVRAVSASGR